MKVNEKTKNFFGALDLREKLFISVVERKNDEFSIIQLEERKCV